jgi:hypothetical protein
MRRAEIPDLQWLADHRDQPGALFLGQHIIGWRTALVDAGHRPRRAPCALTPERDRLSGRKCIGMPGRKP